jgi:hypothetical protein
VSALEDVLCIRCGETVAVEGGFGYCGHCFWAIKDEIEDGLSELSRYLDGWARFADWCAERGLLPPFGSEPSPQPL